MDWVSPVVSGVVGLGGLAVGWRLSTGARTHEVAKWHRERRADAYVELLEVAEDIGHVVAVAFPMVETNPPRPEPELPSGVRQGRARARIAAFGSREVKAAADIWLEAASSALSTAEEVAFFRRAANASEREIRARQRLEDARAAEQAARGALDEAINADLST